MALKPHNEGQESRTHQQVRTMWFQGQQTHPGFAHCWFAAMKTKPVHCLKNQKSISEDNHKHNCSSNYALLQCQGLPSPRRQGRACGRVTITKGPSHSSGLAQSNWQDHDLFPATLTMQPHLCFSETSTLSIFPLRSCRDTWPGALRQP